jgi:hypothetical protein
MSVRWGWRWGSLLCVCGAAIAAGCGGGQGGGSGSSSAGSASGSGAPSGAMGTITVSGTSATSDGMLPYTIAGGTEDYQGYTDHAFVNCTEQQGPSGFSELLIEASGPTGSDTDYVNLAWTDDELSPYETMPPTAVLMARMTVYGGGGTTYDDTRMSLYPVPCTTAITEFSQSHVTGEVDCTGLVPTFGSTGGGDGGDGGDTADLDIAFDCDLVTTME